MSRLGFSCLHWGPSLGMLVMSLAVLSSISLLSSGVAQEQQGTTDHVELEALFEVMASINYETDWRTELPDPCSGNQQGIYCLADDNGTYHVTNLEFGFMSEYDSLITCSSNASLHPAIGQLQFLETLFIYSCFVNSSAALPREIGRLSSSLQILTLHGNPALGGVLPAEIGNLTSLQRMVLTENSFEGPIPEEFGGMRSLLQLELSENRLNGTIPGSFNSLNSLVILDLSCNAISGDLPSLYRLHELQQLVLSNNSLSGRIPEDFGRLSSLTYLDLSGNHLSGGIPTSFESLTKLQDLFLEDNSMDAPLREFVGGMVGLITLSLAGSGFEGEIPQSLGSLANLRVLLLQGNNFSGPIPLALGRLPNIYQLDLSANNLTGPVPFPPSFVKKLGTNLVLSQNWGLCIPPANARQAVAALGVSICDDRNSSGNSGMESGSPNSAPGIAPVSGRALESSNASKRPQITSIHLFTVSAVAIWMACKVRGVP